MPPGVGSTDLAAAMITGRTWFKVPESIKLTYNGTPGPWISGKDIILHTIGRIGVEGARYMAMEFTGPVIDGLPMSDRLTMCNMSIEAGAKVGMINPDDTTLAYVQSRAKRPYVVHRSDPEAEYAARYEFDLTGLEPPGGLPP